MTWFDLHYLNITLFVCLCFLIVLPRMYIFLSNIALFLTFISGIAFYEFFGVLPLFSVCLQEKQKGEVILCVWIVVFFIGKGKDHLGAFEMPENLIS